MNKRLELHAILTAYTTNVYYQPPSTTAMKFPAIVYSKSSAPTVYANDNRYIKNERYTVTIMDKNPDSLLAESLSNLRYSKFDRQFVSNGLNHIVFTITI